MSVPYREKFAVGTCVRVLDHPELDRFAREWRYHHPLTIEQLDCAGHEGRVTEVGFYHGGDALYTVEGLPGIWHEQALVGIARPLPNER